ncbi:MAG: hypothetical protein DRQ49_14230 [Gammaproteobacteria bacterium]|nr:MAG: hypothetical protein DRQ49_14230 [Gammaproteobacteria bacterium]
MQWIQTIFYRYNRIKLIKSLFNQRKMGLAMFIMLGGCAMMTHKSLNPVLVNHTYQIDVLSIIRNDEITIQFDEKQYLSSGRRGLFLALIDEDRLNQMRRKAVHSQIAPLLKVKTNIDFRTQYWNQLQKNLAKSPWLEIKSLDKSTVEYKSVKLAKIQPPLLVLNTLYELSPNAQVLIVQTKARLYLNEVNKPDYLGFNTYYSAPVGKEIDEKAIELWAANNAFIYRKALAEGIEQNMRMLQLDLFDKRANLKKGEEIRLEIRTPISGWTLKVSGHILKQNKNRLLIREKRGGNLFSIATSLIK